MLASRSFSRALPRWLSKSSVRCAQRPISTIHRSSLLQHPWKVAPRPTYAAFSTSGSVWEGEGEGRHRLVEESFAGLIMDSSVDQELSAKIESELRMEKDIRDSDQYPSNVQDYLDNSPFEVRYRRETQMENTDGRQLHDTPGQEEVVLTRKYGDET